MALIQSMGDAWPNQPLLRSAKDDFQRIEGSVEAFTDAVERVLGAPPAPSFSSTSRS